jgi:YesN/AraC family two-component response regulator
MPLRFAAGGIHDSLVNVARSYGEAMRTLDYQNWSGKIGVMGVDMLPAENGYYYPADLELRLTNLARAGDREAVSSLLTELYRINFEERQLSLAMLQLFMNEMWGTIVKLLPQVSMDNDAAFGHIVPADGGAGTFASLNDSFAAIERALHRICEYVSEHKKSQNVVLLDKIVHLLNDGYRQSELCLESVADTFGISKGYLSQFFKEQTGINFSDYLENVRMNRAKQFLVQSDMSVNEIAVQVGYSSSNTFCRAFKRLYGISTTEYRRSHSY